MVTSWYVFCLLVNGWQMRTTKDLYIFNYKGLFRYGKTKMPAHFLFTCNWMATAQQRTCAYLTSSVVWNTEMWSVAPFTSWKQNCHSFFRVICEWPSIVCLNLSLMELFLCDFCCRGQSLPEKFLAEKERLFNVRGQKRRMAHPLHRQKYSDLHIGGHSHGLSNK